jgi:hypothetical protein
MDRLDFGLGLGFWGLGFWSWVLGLGNLSGAKKIKVQSTKDQ